MDQKFLAGEVEKKFIRSTRSCGLEVDKKALTVDWKLTRSSSLLLKPDLSSLEVVEVDQKFLAVWTRSSLQLLTLDYKFIRSTRRQLEVYEKY